MTHQRPEPEGLKEALAAAAHMRSAGEDPQHVARWFIRFHRRCLGLDALLQIADRYLRFGMPRHELSEMRRVQPCVMVRPPPWKPPAAVPGRCFSRHLPMW